MTLHRTLIAATLSLSAWVAHAHDFKLGELQIGYPYARATAQGQTAGGAFLSVENRGSAADRLLSASAEVAKSVELHEMKMDGDVMRMRPVNAIDLPAGKTVALKPGGLHVMLIGLNAPLKAGSSFPMKLKFEKAGEVTVQVNVEAAHGQPQTHKH